MTYQLSDHVVFDLALTAMTVWELVIMDTNEDQYPGIHRYWKHHGVCETRERMFELARPACAIWDLMMTEGWYFDGPFDFEFLPLYLRTCTTATIKGTDPVCCIEPTGYREAAYQMHQWATSSSADQALAEQKLRALAGFN